MSEAKGMIKFMKKKKYLYISIGFVAALAIVLVMGMRQNVDRAQIQEMEQLCSEVLPYISLGEKSSVAAQASQFSYQGIVASSSELNSGLAKFSNGTFDYYVDSAFDQLRKVESMSDFNLDATPLAEDEILAASDQLFITASGEDIFSGCVKNVSQASDELSYSIDYTYMKGDVGVPAASITYLYDGTLFYAYFYNMDVLDNPELQSLGDPALSAEEAIEIAKETAEEFIARKAGEDAENYALDEDSLEYKKWYMRNENRDSWLISMYYWKPNYDIPFYFDLFIDMYTGEVLLNANNYT